MPPAYLFALAILLCGFVLKRLQQLFRQRQVPPGPVGLPVIGNLHQIPRQFPWFKFTEWKEQYGPIFSLNVPGHTIIVLNTHTVATDLIDKRSHIYSDRPQTVVAGQLLTGGYIMPLAGYGDRWRRLRRATHEALHLHAVEKYLPLQQIEATRLIASILRKPDSWHDFAARSSASVALSMIYGMPPIESQEDPVIVKINQFMERIAHSQLPGTFLADIFPSMMLIPERWAKWKRDALYWHDHDDRLFKGLMNPVYEAVKNDNFQPSFASTLAQNALRNGVSEKEAAWLSGSMFAAGSHSTAATYEVFMLAMTLYPEVQKRAQSEIDQVVGRNRLPCFDDRENMPYMACMIRECLRWRPVAPIGGPRRAVQDDWYNGYLIPKGSLVLFNTWAINRDPTVFEDVDEFMPERYMDEVGRYGIAPGMHAQGHATYGYGRRICSGVHFANAELFINMAMTLWAFNITQSTGSDGKLIIPSRTENIDEGFVVIPAPFNCNVTARHDDVEVVIAKAVEYQ